MSYWCICILYTVFKERDISSVWIMSRTGHSASSPAPQVWCTSHSPDIWRTVASKRTRANNRSSWVCLRCMRIQSKRLPKRRLRGEIATQRVVDANQMRQFCTQHDYLYFWLFFSSIGWNPQTIRCTHLVILPTSRSTLVSPIRVFRRHLCTYCVL